MSYKVNTQPRMIAAVTLAAGMLVACANGASATRTFIIQNNCNQTIWPGIYEEGIDGAAAPNPQPMNGGWQLGSGQSTTLVLPEGFSGRFWARKDCTFNASGVGSCETGDCGGVLQCNGATGVAGTSLAEFTLWQPQNPTAFPQDWYDVSYVDGYDFPVSITPSNTSYMAPSCSFDVLPSCPPGQQVKNAAGVVVQCLSACVAYGTDPSVPAAVQEQYCCSPPYNNSQLCNPSTFPNPPGNIDAPFKSACPNSYSWSDDDPTSVWHYAGNSSVTYTVTFCPTSGYGTVVQTSGTGEYDGPTTTSGTWNSCPAATVPVAPAPVTATEASGQAILTWAASTGATSYDIYRSTASGGEGSSAFVSDVVGTTYTDSAVTDGTTYYYTLAAVNSAGTSAQSVQVSTTPGTVGAPVAPTGLTATAGNAQVALSWTASSGATSYNVYRGTASGGESATAIVTAITTTAYTNTGLTNGTAYYYKVAAVDSSGTSAQSSEVSATPSSSAGGTYGGTWKLTPENATSLYLYAAGSASGSAVEADSTASSWVISDTGVTPSGDYTFTLSGYSVCLYAAGTTSGSNVELYTCNGSSGEAWNIVKDGAPVGYYQISPSNGGGLVLDNTGTSSGSTVEVVTANSSSAQQWEGL